MKGTITRCLALLVKSKAGGDTAWKQIVADAKAGEEYLELASADVDDAAVGRLLASTCKVLGLTEEQACNAFGEYWCCEYAPKVYSAYVKRFTSSREMILGMDQIHIEVTNTMDKARPPRFDYKWTNDKTLVVTYKSPRGMVKVYAGLVRGVGKFFKENIRAKVVGTTQVEVAFP